jgi:hypothetical protein
MGVSWLKKGNDSAQIAQKEAEAAKLRQEVGYGMGRFWLVKGEDARVTFVDGDLDANGFLNPPRFFEHNVFVQGQQPKFFVCPKESFPHLGESCPICAGGDHPTLVSIFTIIDHREFKGKKDPTKVYKDTPRLFVAKSGTMEMLTKIAIKRGGLAGCTFDVSRSNDSKSASVGNMFDFTEKNDIADLVKKYMQEFTDPKTNKKEMRSIFVPADYEKEIKFFTGEELAKLGFGSPQVSGYGSQGQQNQQAMTDYSADL